MRSAIGRTSVCAAVLVIAGLADSHREAQVAALKTPLKTKDVKPIYPAKSLLAGDEGAVTVALKIGPSGSVTDARVISSTCPVLNEAALTAARQWRYEIVKVNGEPSEFAMTANVPFRLPESIKSRRGRPGACKWMDPPKPIY